MTSVKQAWRRWTTQPDRLRTVVNLRTDPSPEVRHRTVPILLRLAGRDPRARDALAAAVHDVDPLVRHVAQAAVEGRHGEAQRSRHDLLRRRQTRRNKARQRHLQNGS